MRDWVNQFENDYWLGNSAKTLSDVGLLPSKAKSGQKRGKKELSLQEHEKTMKNKEKIYEDFKGDRKKKQKLKNQWANARSIYNFKAERAWLDQICSYL